MQRNAIYYLGEFDSDCLPFSLSLRKRSDVNNRNGKRVQEKCHFQWWWGNNSCTEKACLPTHPDPQNVTGEFKEVNAIKTPNQKEGQIDINFLPRFSAASKLWRTSQSILYLKREAFPAIFFSRHQSCERRWGKLAFNKGQMPRSPSISGEHQSHCKVW